MIKNIRSSKGFTLVELLIVIAIITILATFLIPSIGTGREKARKAKCLNNVRVLTTQALLNSEDAQGSFQGYPQYLGELFPDGTDRELDIDAAHCPSMQPPYPTASGNRISNGNYNLVQYSGVQPGTYPYIYDISGNHSDGQNVGYIAGNVKFVQGGGVSPGGSGTVVTQ